MLELTLWPLAQIILPFTVAIISLVAHSYDLDPLLVFMGLSETVSRLHFLPFLPSPLTL